MLPTSAKKSSADGTHWNDSESLYLVGLERNFARGEISVVSSGLVSGGLVLLVDMEELSEMEGREKK